jgi:hypothetical protein
MTTLLVLGMVSRWIGWPVADPRCCRGQMRDAVAEPSASVMLVNIHIGHADRYSQMIIWGDPAFTSQGSSIHSVASTTSAGSIRTGRPGFARSSNPPTPSAANRRFQPRPIDIIGPPGGSVTAPVSSGADGGHELVML